MTNFNKLMLMTMAFGAVTPMTAATVMNETLQNATNQRHELIARTPMKAEIPDNFVFPDADELITEAPAGVVKQYIRDGYYWMVGLGWMMFDYKQNCAAEMVEGDDGYVYIKNPYTDFVSNSYLKGKREGDKIKVSLPQPIYREPDMTDPGTFNTYYACVMVEEAPGSDYYLLTDRTELTYTVGEDDKITLDLDYIPQQDPWGGWEYPYYILGMITDEGIWMSEGEAAQTWTPFTGVKTEVPEGLEFEDWAMTYSTGGQFVEVGVDGNDFYIKNLMPQLPDGVFKGTLEGDKVVFPSGQYLGIYNFDSYCYFVGMSYDENDNASLSDQVEFTYDKENRILKAAENTAIAFSRNAESLSVIKLWRAPQIRVQPDDIDQTPLAPTFIEYKAFTDEEGQGYFRFDLPIYNKDGYVLNERNMYYNVFFDGALETFYTDEYTRLEEDMTDVPYTFGDGWNFYALGTVHVLYYYSRGVKEAGIRLSNKVDGTVYSSPVTTLNLETGEVNSGIDGIAAGVTVASEEWFSLDGKRVSRPAAGIYVRRAVMSDGTVKVEKTVVR